MNDMNINQVLARMQAMALQAANKVPETGGSIDFASL